MPGRQEKLKWSLGSCMGFRIRWFDLENDELCAMRCGWMVYITDVIKLYVYAFFFRSLSFSFSFSRPPFALLLFMNRDGVWCMCVIPQFWHLHILNKHSALFSWIFAWRINIISRWVGWHEHTADTHESTISASGLCCSTTWRLVWRGVCA